MISRTCPKCSSVLREYDRKGEMWLRCRDCKLTLPATALEVPDDAGLGDLKALPVAPDDGLAGVKTAVIPYAASNLQKVSPNNSETGTCEAKPASTYLGQVHKSERPKKSRIEHHAD